MADYSRRDAEFAGDVLNRLMAGEGEGLDLRPDIAISDIEADANAFTAELDILREIGANVPAVTIDDELVPVSLDFAITGSADRALPPWTTRGIVRRWRHHPYFYEFAYDLLRGLREQRAFDGFATVNPEAARTTFVKRATEFVATRIAAVRRYRENEPDSPWRRQQSSFLNMPQRLGGPRVGTPGCHFTVSSNSNGLRVFWSGAYYVSPNNFNHPTSPTSSILQSGTYIFGVDGGAYGNAIQWDLNAVVSLPGLPFVHLNF